MKTLSFRYKLRIHFSDPVSHHHFTVRCVPQSSARQQILECETHILPDEALGSSLDSFGNRCIYGQCGHMHTLFSAEVSGKARTGLADTEPAREAYQIGLYRYPTRYTRPGEQLKKFFRGIHQEPGRSDLERALYLMEQLSAVFSYEKGVTDASSCAEEAFSFGCGVCQDYAHIFIALCRMAGIPARYVTGMLIGEGESHAWVEIYQDRSWIALDPTNMLTVGDGHIRISCGRDAGDCPMNQGIFTGNAQQSQEVEVFVEEIGDNRIGRDAGR